jgi:hypothetical protein
MSPRCAVAKAAAAMLRKVRRPSPLRQTYLLRAFRFVSRCHGVVQTCGLGFRRVNRIYEITPVPDGQMLLEAHTLETDGRLGHGS